VDAHGTLGIFHVATDVPGSAAEQHALNEAKEGTKVFCIVRFALRKRVETLEAAIPTVGSSNPSGHRTLRRLEIPVYRFWWSPLGLPVLGVLKQNVSDWLPST
jgi:hypothetical protein